MLVGAGTVLTVEQARAAVNAGARFLVSPVCDPVVISEAHKLGVPAIPGTFTATEMETAHRAGADFVKLFPAPADLPSYIASILAPLPHLRIYPTNGVTVDNVLDVLRAGAADQRRGMLEAAVWRALRERPRAGLAVEETRPFPAACREIAVRLGISKLVWVDPAGGLLRADGSRPSFVDLEELCR